MAVVIGPGLLHGGRLLDMDMNDDDWRDKRRVSHRNCIRFTKRVWRRLIAKRRRLAAVGIIVGLFFVLGFLLSERPQLSLPQTASDETLHSSSNTSTQDTHIPNSLRFDPTWDSWAIALKTGQDVALTRTPIQLLTFLSSVRNKIVIGEAPGVTIGDQEMIDVFTGLYEKYPLNETEKYKKSPLDFSVEPQFDRRSLTEPMSGVGVLFFIYTAIISSHANKRLCKKVGI